MGDCGFNHRSVYPTPFTMDTSWPRPLNTSISVNVYMERSHFQIFWCYEAPTSTVNLALLPFSSPMLAWQTSYAALVNHRSSFSRLPQRPNNEASESRPPAINLRWPRSSISSWLVGPP